LRSIGCSDDFVFRVDYRLVRFVVKLDGPIEPTLERLHLLDAFVDLSLGCCRGPSKPPVVVEDR
jgi:hypothetical protein